MLDKFKRKPPSLEPRRLKRPNLGRLKSLILSGLFLLCGPQNTLMAVDYSMSLNDTQFRHTEEHLTVPQEVKATIRIENTEKEESGQLKWEWYMPGEILYQGNVQSRSYFIEF